MDTTPTPATSSPSAPRAEAKTLDKGIRILKALAADPGGLGVAELARQVRIHRTVAYRLLGTLERHGLVSQQEDGRYLLGLTIVELSGAARTDIRSIAHRPLRALADEARSTAVLQRLDGDDIVCLMVVEPGTSAAHVAYQIGLRQPALSDPSGIALLRAAGTLGPHATPQVELGPDGYVVTRDNARTPWTLATPVPRPGGTPDTCVAVLALQPLPVPEIAELTTRAALLIGERMAALGPPRR